ncbi:DUF1801 domain-containing protein [Pseudoxanthomonas sacheonensis]|uniref:Uncharacterized protein YdhG (YjbR/CyaY superfamily) n=1 Tax=Pseudoxanthomonas sacheonensis TaxID=443615 RepID=A0ABU1RS57_9GAMM|nr:DUF1801 domain-containing protein [Pseudoxanthomonas sacheonensis]MDR6841422.1 uncharacterized protein YdhG (YjbR/CyaY superfamily) [Pseudoxanthomonas sacheonensis]
MVGSAATTVEAYLAELPPERREVIATVRALVNANLPDGYVEGMNWGMVSWEIPLSRYPVTYNKQPLIYAALAAQKNHYALYLMCAYADSQNERDLRAAYAAAGLKLDLGKSCLRFRRLDALLQSAVAAAIASTPPEVHIARYEASRVRD